MMNEVQKLASCLAPVSPSWYFGQDLAGNSQHQVIVFDVFNLINDWIYPLYLGMLR